MLDFNRKNEGGKGNCHDYFDGGSCESSTDQYIGSGACNAEEEQTVTWETKDTEYGSIGVSWEKA